MINLEVVAYYLMPHNLSIMIYLVERGLSNMLPNLGSHV